MKLKDVNMIRHAEFALFLGGSLWALYPNSIQMQQALQSSSENLEFFKNVLLEVANKRDLFPDGDVMTIFSVFPLYADLLFLGSKMEYYSTECKRINELYNCVLDNTGELMKTFCLDSPIAIYAMYIYLYRNGYLSINHQFNYSMYLKDFPKLTGVDIVTGNGLCRTIASFLSDLYEKMGYDSETIDVYTPYEACKNLEKLCPTPLQKDKTTSKLVSIARIESGIIKNANHLITRVQHGGINYVLDPTNDGILYSKGNKFIVGGHEELAMLFRPLTTSLSRLMGQYEGSISMRDTKKKLELPSIDIDEYRRIYLETLKICQLNPDILEQFYHTSCDLYEEINSIMATQNDFVRRKVPIVPKKKH